MHDIRWIRENAAEFDQTLNRRPLDAESQKNFASAKLLEIDGRRRVARSGRDQGGLLGGRPACLGEPVDEGGGQ